MIESTLRSHSSAYISDYTTELVGHKEIQNQKEADNYREFMTHTLSEYELDQKSQMPQIVLAIILLAILF